jgi:hypothetical protein
MVWIALAALMLAVLGAAMWASEPPAPLPIDAPSDRFSEGRARGIVRRLSEEIGLRVNGTPAHARAAEVLAAELRTIPGLEVEIQRVSGTEVYRTVKLPPFVYRTLNVVARLPGRSSRAVLLNAHFDTLVDSVGAADDAAGVAAIVETVRVLAREAPLAHTVVINLNGGEEAGLFGAAGFLQHRWATDVRAYLYLEALPGGKAGLLGAGPGEPWLARTYARVAPSPLASVVGQDLVQSGLLPHNGDFTPFHEAGLRGLDVAMTGDGWAYHTGLDRTERLQPGGLQHMGDTALSVTRALANGPFPEKPDAARAVYYDILGLTMVAHRATTGRALSLGALILTALTLALLRRRGLISLRRTLGALLWTLLSVIAGLAAAVAASLLLVLVFGRPHGWFSSPALVLPTFAAPAGAGMLGVHALWRRRGLRTTDVDRHARTAWAGGLLFWSIWLGLATWANVGAGYLALYWVLGSAGGIMLSWLFPRARTAVALISLIPGTVVTIELATLFLNYFLPITGMLPAPMPLDSLVAALVGATVVAVGALGFTVPHQVGGFGRAAVGCAAVAVLGLALTAAHFPYSKERPKRLILAHAGDDRTSALLLVSGDALGMAPVLSFVPEFRPVPESKTVGSGWPPYEIWSPPFTHQRAAGPPDLSPPGIEVTFDEYDALTDRRDLRIRVSGPGAQLRLSVPSVRLRGWSLAPSLDATLAVRGQHVAHFEGLGAEGHELALTVTGRAPLPIELRAIDRLPARDADVEAVKRRLPAWTTTTVVSVRVTRRNL